jgi:GH43 family beta-xylosidase
VKKHERENFMTTSSRRAFLAGTAASFGTAACVPSLRSRAPIITNPLVRQRADAQIFRHTDGSYYMTASVPEYDRIILRRAPTIAELATAPETMLGQLQTPWDTFNLDSTVFTHRGVRYMAWAQREPGIETNSNLYLAPLATPLTFAAKPTRLTVPTLPWEVQGFKVAEGPAPLVRNGRFFMTYSASATDARYCMGMLTARDDADLMNPASWTKSPVPVFQSSPENNVWGPGHNSFTVDERGRDMLVYHARDYRNIEGDPLFDPNRHTRVQPIRYRPDGTPDFGVPVRNGALLFLAK